MAMRMKVFFSTMWDLYFFWRFDCKEKMGTLDFEKEIKNHLSFLFNENEIMPDLKEAIKELYMKYMFRLDEYYQSPEKVEFVEKYSI